MHDFHIAVQVLVRPLRIMFFESTLHDESPTRQALQGMLV